MALPLAEDDDDDDDEEEEEDDDDGVGEPDVLPLLRNSWYTCGSDLTK